MYPPEHPDTLANQQQIKSITRGGTQAADSAAMEAYWQALENGMTVSEAGEVFIKTYQSVVNKKL